MSDTKEKYSEKRRMGNIGEDLATLFLVKSGYEIVERNYLKKWGEIDIVAEKGHVLHFIEVKSSSRSYTGTLSRESTKTNIVSRLFSRNSFTNNDFKIVSLSRESDDEEYRPEENVHYFKQKKMIRTIETYLLERGVGEDQEWQIDVMTAKIDFSQKVCIIKHIENVVFDV